MNVLIDQMLRKIIRFSGDDDRDYRRTPWHKDCFSYSTNGYILFRVPGEYGVNSESIFVPTLETFDFKALDEAQDCVYIDPVALRFRESNHICPECDPEISEPEIIKCRKCFGTGTTECFHCGSEIECEDCDGMGTVSGLVPRCQCTLCIGSGTNPLQRIKIGKNSYSSSKILFLLENFPNVRFFPEVSVGDKFILGFKFSETGTGAIMCLRD